jgi:hypothetical protein
LLPYGLPGLGKIEELAARGPIRAEHSGLVARGLEFSGFCYLLIGYCALAGSSLDMDMGSWDKAEAKVRIL